MPKTINHRIGFIPQPALCSAGRRCRSINGVADFAGFPAPYRFRPISVRVKMVNALPCQGRIVVTSELIKFAESLKKVAAVLSAMKWRTPYAIIRPVWFSGLFDQPFLRQQFCSHWGGLF